MNKKLRSIITSLVLVVCMLGVMVMSAACNNKSGEGSIVGSVVNTNSGSAAGNNGSNGSARPSTSTQPGTNTSTPEQASTSKGGFPGASVISGTTEPGTVDPVPSAAVDRSDYNVMSIVANVMNTSVYDLTMAIAQGDASMLEGYRLGDVVNFLINYAVSVAANVEGADYSAFLYTYYEDGTWASRIAPRANTKIVSAILNFKLDFSEPIALTAADIEQYGEQTIIDVLGFGSNLVILSLVEENVLLNAFANAKLQDVVGIFGGDEETAVTSLLNIFGDLTVEDVMALCGVEAKEGVEIPEITVRELVNKFVETYASVSEIIAEGGYEALYQYVLSQALNVVNEYVAEHGEEELIPGTGVTINDYLAALLGEDYEAQMKVIKASATVLVAYAQENMDAIMAQIAPYYEEYKEYAVYGEYTLEELVAAFEEAAPAEVVDALFAEYEKLTTDENYWKEVINPWTVLAAQYMNEVEVIPGTGVTAADIVKMLKSFSAEGSEETLEAILNFANSYLAGYLGEDTTVQMYYEMVKDMPLYYDAEEDVVLTIDEIVAKAYALDSAKAVYEKLVELLNDPETLENIEKGIELTMNALASEEEQEKLDEEVIPGYTGGQILAALTDFSADDSAEVFEALVAYIDGYLAEYDVTLEGLYDMYYPMIKDLVVFCEVESEYKEIEEGVYVQYYEVKKTYTVDEIIANAIELNSVTEIYLKAVELFNDDLTFVGIDKAMPLFAEQVMGIAMAQEVIEGVTIADIYAALDDFDAETSAATFEAIAAYIDGYLAMYDLSLEGLTETFYEGLKDVVVYDGKTLEELVNEIVELDNVDGVYRYILSAIAEIENGNYEALEFDNYDEIAFYFMQIVDEYFTEMYGDFPITEDITYSTLKETVVYGEYTLGQLIEMTKDDEAFETFIAEEAEKFAEDPDYAWTAFTPAIRIVLNELEPYGDRYSVLFMDVEYYLADLIEDVNAFLDEETTENLFDALGQIMGKKVDDVISYVGASMFLPVIEDEDFNACLSALLDLSIADYQSGAYEEIIVNYLKALKVASVPALVSELVNYYVDTFGTIEYEEEYDDGDVIFDDDYDYGYGYVD